jgi:hypothetical protein
MHVAQCQQNLTCIEHSYIIAEPPILPQPIEQLTSTAIFEQHVDKYVILEGCF